MTAYPALIQKLSHRLSLPLPGEDAQFMMAPLQRPRMVEAMQTATDPRLSAVLLLLYPVEQEIHTVLIKRKAYEGVHSAQVSFPGGKKDPDDTDLAATALREAQEEIGLGPATVTLIGQLSEVFIPPSGFLVTPYVGFTPDKPVFKPDPREVQEIIEAPLALVLNDQQVKRSSIPLGRNRQIKDTPYFDIHGHMVWGATAMMISEFKVLVRETGSHFP